METITLQCPITVKAKVNEKFKTDVCHNLDRQIERINAELSHIEKDMKRVLSEQSTGNVQRVSQLLQRMEEEKQKRLALRENLKNKITDTNELEIGSEVIQGTLQRLVEVKIGDTMPEILNTELLVEDGKIIEMRD